MIKSTPRIYQKEAISLSSNFLKDYGYAFFDVDPGLGKTLMSLCLAVNYQTIIVICPKTLVKTWINQLYEHTELSHYVLIWDYQRAKTDTWLRVYQNWKKLSI